MWRLDGAQGSLLWVAAASDGHKLAEQKIDGLPVFDGMAAAEGKLFISLNNGRLVCLE